MNPFKLHALEAQPKYSGQRLQCVCDEDKIGIPNAAAMRLQIASETHS